MRSREMERIRSERKGKDKKGEKRKCWEVKIRKDEKGEKRKGWEVKNKKRWEVREKERMRSEK